MTRRVVHGLQRFLPRSETFINTLINAHRHYEASVLCQIRENAAEFPFPRVYVHAKPLTKWQPRWWINETFDRATGRSLWRRAVETTLARVQPSVVHAHFGPTACELVGLTRTAGIPLVTSLYGVDAAVLPYLPYWRAQYQRLFRDGDLFLAEGPEMRKKIIAAGAPAERTVIQPIPIELSRYPSWAPTDRLTVLFAGRFVEKKGLIDSIAAFAKARHQVPALRLVVVGDGPDEADARALIAKLDLELAVEFTGAMPHGDLIRRLAAASVLIHPSVTAADGDSEGGAPTILLEAQAIGTPIVTTRHADIPHVAPAGPGIHHCDEHDVEALGEALVAALDAGERSSAAHVIAHHEAGQAVERLEDLYSALADRRAAAAVAS